MKCPTPTQSILSIPVTCSNFEEQINTINEWCKSRKSKTVCLANVHMLVEAHQNPQFSQVLQNADLVAPDGMPLVWMLRMLSNPQQDRVAGVDVFTSLCNLSAQSGTKVFFVGSHAEVLAKIKQRLGREFPALKIAGMESLPFRPLTEEEDEALIHRINQSGAGLTFVCLGCPKQEIWMDAHHNKIQSVAIGVGAVFEVYAGLKKRAPYFIRNIGLEWLYRLIQEPKRLWKRYYQTIPTFIYLAIEQIYKEKRSIKSSSYTSKVIK